MVLGLSPGLDSLLGFGFFPRVWILSPSLNSLPDFGLSPRIWILFPDLGAIPGAEFSPRALPKFGFFPQVWIVPPSLDSLPGSGGSPRFWILSPNLDSVPGSEGSVSPPRGCVTCPGKGRKGKGKGRRIPGANPTSLRAGIRGVPARCHLGVPSAKSLPGNPSGSSHPLQLFPLPCAPRAGILGRDF